MNPTVSIIIPAYNAAAYLQRAVASALAQTFANIEVVVVDDGSTDETPSLADQLASQDQRIRVVHQSNRGLAEARRTGVNAASGDYVCHLDADDELTPDAVDFLLGKCQSDNLDLAYGSHIKVLDNGSEQHKPYPTEAVMTGEQFLAFLFDRRCLCASWGNVCQRDIWLKDIYPLGDQVLPNEDTLMNAKISQYVNRVGFYNHPVYRYYYVGGSLSVSGRLSQLDRWKAYFDQFTDNLRNRGLLQRHQRDLLMLKLDRLAFYIYPLDAHDEWVQQVINDHSMALPLKYRVLRCLLHCPRLCHWLVILNRKCKRLLNR